MEDLSKLELAAQILMASPNQVSAQDRKEAESYFIKLREQGIPVDQCRQILETTQNHFLMFELARALVARLLKEWSRFSSEDVRNICQYLLNFPVTHQNIPNFVSTEMFHSAAMIVKRSSLITADLFTDLIVVLENFLNSENQQLRANGLQIIELICTEFSTAWRSSNISISWDFHIRAKKQFEDVLLKQLMQLSLQTLSRLICNSDLSSPVDQQVFDKFLCVASLIFCWNFSPKYLYLHFKMLINALRPNTFRPPESWHDLFKDTTIITFFMELHSRVRFNEQLCQNSLICITQLASLMGEALGPSGPIVLILPQISNLCERRLATSMSGNELENAGTDRKFLHDQYVQVFAQHLIQLFSNCVLDHEMASLSIVIYKLFTCHPIAIYERFPHELLINLINFVASNILKLIQPAMNLALQKNDRTYHEPLNNLLQAWRTILRSAHIFNKDVSNIIEARNPEIIDAFIKSILAPPYGTRANQISREILDENEEEDDDRTVFMDILCDIGYFSLYSIDYFVDYIVRAMVQRLKQLTNLDLSLSKPEELHIWQEDFHWLLLLTGYFIRQPAYSNIGNFPEELAIRCINGYNANEFVKIDDYEPLFNACITNPPFDLATYPGKLDPITLISTQILSWFSLEHQMLLKLDPNAPLLSPTLCQTSLWQFSLLMIVLTPSIVPNDSGKADERLCEDEEEITIQLDKLKHLPAIIPKSALSTKIIQMGLEKMFAILTKMAGEKRLCADVIDLLINFAEYRSEELVTNEHLYSLLNGLNIENLPSRRALVKSLVLIGSIVESEVLRQKMHSTILEPLMNRFLILCESRDRTTDSTLADYFECFTGIADAAQADTALILFGFLQPVYEGTVTLIRLRPDSQLLLVSILEFFKSNTDIIFFYVESHDHTKGYHQLLLDIVNAYKDTQLQRFCSTTLSANTDEEQQTQDLSTLIEILCLSISKTYLPLIDSPTSAIDSAKVSLHGLEILLPLMNEDLLKIPQLCTSFFRLLVYISDIAPAALTQVSEQMLIDFLKCAQFGLENVFGFDRVRSALEIVTNLANYCNIQMHKRTLVNYFMVDNILKLVPKVFELTMQFSCEVEIFNEATSGLYTLIELNRDAFKAYVHELINLPANLEMKTHLEQAFAKLFKAFEDSMVSHSEKHTSFRKRTFQNKFQEFLIDVSGSLCFS